LKEGFLPCNQEGEEHHTITQEEFKKNLRNTLRLKIKMDIS